MLNNHECIFCRKRSSTRRKWFKSKSSTSKDYDVVPGSTADKEGAAEMTDMASLHSKAPPPPRPPPPSGSVTSVQLQAASSPRDDSTSPLANSDGVYIRSTFVLRESYQLCRFVVLQQLILCGTHRFNDGSLIGC